MKKKLLSLALACVMIVTLAVPAFASKYYEHESSSSDNLTQTITIAARTFVPTVRLYLPVFTGDSVVLNPYKISYTGDGNALNGQTVGNATDPDGDAFKQVISPVYSIKNDTDVKLNFSVVATAAVEGELTLVNDFVPLTDTGKKAHIVVVIEKVATTTVPAVGTGVKQELDRFDKATFETITLKSTGEAKTGAEVKYLPAVAAAASPVSNYLRFQFQGDMTRQPTKSWTADDKVSATLVFTFTPESKADGTTSKDDSSTAIAFADTSLTATTYKLPPTATPDFASITGFTIHATAPDWTLISSTLDGVTVTGTAPDYVVNLTVDAQKNLPKDSTAHDYTLVLGCKDVNEVPRTVMATLKLARAGS